MTEFPKDFREFLQLLNSGKIEYLVIGGYAVGYPDFGIFKVNFLIITDLGEGLKPHRGGIFVAAAGRQPHIELDIASCGDTKEEAVEGLRNAVEAYLDYMISEGREKEIYRPVPIKDLKDFLFSGHTLSEQSLNAVPLEFEYAV